MKTRFSIAREVFLTRGSLEECYMYYEEYYKMHGFILDKPSEDVYIDFDHEMHLKEGDRVMLFGLRIVEWKCIDPTENVIIYALKEE